MKYCHLAFLTFFTLSLSACSSQHKLNTFKQDYNTHTYSEYVKDNLKNTPRDHSVDSKTKNNHAKQLKALQRLAAQKSRSNTHIATTIQQNGLFTPPAALQQQADRLNRSENKQQAYESWLQEKPSLNKLLTIALNNNLDIQQRLQESKANLAKYDQVSFLDDTLAQYAAFTKGLAVPIGKPKHNRSVVDSFPFSGLLSLKAAIIDQTVESSRLQLKQTVQDILTQTRIAYYELQLARQERGVIAQNIVLLQSLKQQLNDSYATSTTTINTLLQVDIALEKNRNKREITRNKITIQQARLNALLNLSPSFSMAKLAKLSPLKLTATIEQRLQQGQQRVEIVRLQSELKKMAQIIRLSEKRFYPDFSAGYSRFQNQASQQTGSNANKATFSTRPQFKKRNFFGSNDAYLNETKLKYQALQSQLNALINQTNEAIQQAMAGYNTQKSTYRLYQDKVIPQTRITLESTKELFATGGSSYLDVINTQQQLLDYRLLSLKAIKAMNSNAAKLSRLVGQSL